MDSSSQATVTDTITTTVPDQSAVMGHETVLQVVQTASGSISTRNPHASSLSLSQHAQTHPKSKQMDSSSQAAVTDSSTTTVPDRGAVMEHKPVPLLVQTPSGSTSTLNPHAKPWDVPDRNPDEYARSLFLTFSKGFPLNEAQIARFFNLQYGAYVENVYVHWPEPRRSNPPLFGKVMFKSPCFPDLILKGQNQAKFFVDGRPLWCKKFDPNKKHAGRGTKG